MSAAALTATGCARGPSVAALMHPDAILAGGVAPATFRVRFETSQGDFVARVTRADSPLGVDRFYALVRAGFYDGQRFFRVRKGFIAQFGLHGDPAVIAVWKRRTLPDDPPRAKNVRGSLAYAFTTANTRATQIYINLADNDQLNAEAFSPFAQIVEGIDVIDRLYSEYDESAGGGMRGGKQGKIEAGGNAYLASNFPKLDYIRRVRVVP